ncbi:AAA family ATPase [Enterobacter hormaechei]|uniref:AAA family ATPase n=1 Tax=Enterobacter hormaechei TaxID=158836 RepID=UPI002075567D|nr:AAA family ATPase [Enterobacter hormaechei]MCM7954964.1 AAA family ATPase [Enterobacter hormaechei]MCM7978889.1 AAA family ATPase [Enterobacter hormaechei]MCM7983828.1 AAA family ATPase [Enterobacter hormaechei]MCM8205223.1 AAA family ATPase [Enterobacter hormaechei]MCM8232599.1 AAA family ATPase [Enterobacter hormaechei]
MIDELTIRNAGSYTGPEQKLHGLSTFNYFYGANGAGKTTISKIINEPDNYPDCLIQWRNSRKLKSYVYNKDFVDGNFSQDKIKGVFTLGSDIKGEQDKLSLFNEQKNKIQEGIATKQKLLFGSADDVGVIKELDDQDKSFKDICWKQKQKHDDVFFKAFEGLRNSAEKFKTRVLSEFKHNTEALIPLVELTEKCRTVFSDELISYSPLSIPKFDGFKSILENGIWREKILGKKDVSVSDLIMVLNNSDWVKKGVEYLHQSKPQCPFCQQEVSDDIFQNLSSYFDETYNKKQQQVNGLLSEYHAHIQRFRWEIDNIRDAKLHFIDIDIFEDKSNIILALLLNNFEKAQSKERLLSEIIVFDSMDAAIEDFSLFIKSINAKIDANNALYNNIKAEQKKLKEQIWAYITRSELKTDIETYLTAQNKLEKKRDGLNTGVEKETEKLIELRKKIEEIESSQTSILPTVHAINKILKCYGFTNFHLKPSEDKAHYVIVRDSGDNARLTLSEGERTFITFLYYYSLVRGSNQSSGVLEERVVVFDDPISSLDSDILFIVSSLIKNLMDDVRENKGSIKQIIILTHNIYFHKELTFNTKRSENNAMNEETFWVVRKKDKKSYVEKCMTNPIKTSYDLLWSELRRSDKNNGTIQNTMRRILENYFKILGGVDVRQLECHFEGYEKLIFKSLVSWINDGSHFAGDDVYMNLDDVSVEKNLIVFQKIFECSQHTAHYKMMMGDSYKPLDILAQPDDIDLEPSANDDDMKVDSDADVESSLLSGDDAPF